MAALITVAETPEYLRCAQRLLSAVERADVVAYLVAHPRAGDLSKAERNDLASLVRILKAMAGN